MKVGASYYPELLPRAAWAQDLATGREIGLSALRVGEFAWSALAPAPGAWETGWARDFLGQAGAAGYDVIWCTPSATPPPYLFDRWPELQAVNVHGHIMNVGGRRHACPSHAGYRELSAETATRLARDLHGAPVVGWQVDNEIAGDGFTCWCPRCREAFQTWLEARYGSLDALNAAWQTDLWAGRYTAWAQIPMPFNFQNHTPAIKLAYRRFRSENWQAFYRVQADALRAAGAGPVTTNWYNLTWDIPFDQWAWRPEVDTIGISHYLEDENASRFQLDVLRGPTPGDKPLWVLEQKAGQQNAQNWYPEDLDRLARHLRICAEYGAVYAIYWHLRQHTAGCEMEHGAVLRHDGTPTRVARAIQAAIRDTAHTPVHPAGDALLAFSFPQQWAQEMRPQPGTAWQYRVEVEEHWYAGARMALGGVRVGPPRAIAEAKLALAPFLQIEEPGVLEAIRACAAAGGTVVLTADFGRLDGENNVRRVPPLEALRSFGTVPDLEMLHLRPEAHVRGEISARTIGGRLFWAVPEGEAVGIGTLSDGAYTGPAALVLPVGKGGIIVALTALDARGVATLLRAVA
jgi:beta-galactosidase